MTHENLYVFMKNQDFWDDCMAENMTFWADFFGREKYVPGSIFWVGKTFFRDAPRIILGPSRDHPGIILSSFKTILRSFLISFLVGKN